MADWIFDEDITRPTVEMFNKAGIGGLHIKYDLDLGGIDDESVLQIAKKKKKALITANARDFIKIPNVDFHRTYGTFILKTDDPKQQVELVKTTIQVGDLGTRQKRMEKKVIITDRTADITNTRTNQKETVNLKKTKKGTRDRLHSK